MRIWYNNDDTTAPLRYVNINKHRQKYTDKTVNHGTILAATKSTKRRNHIFMKLDYYGYKAYIVKCMTEIHSVHSMARSKCESLMHVNHMSIEASQK